MHRNMLPPTGNTANFQKSRSCTNKLTQRMDWTEHREGAAGESTRKTSASTLKAGELKNSQTGMSYFKKGGW